MDPVVGAGLIVVSGAAALLSGIVALVVLVRRRRISRVAVACGAVSVAVAVGCMMAMPPGYSASERERIEQLHARFAPALERYRQAHGAYPPTLEAAGIPTPQTRYGPLRYEVRREKDGTSAYSIGYGDYNLNGFSAWWSSDVKEWYVDS